MGSQAQRPRWRRWLRRALLGVGILLLAVVILLASLLFALGRPSVQDWLVPLVLEQTRGILPGLKIKKLRGPMLGALAVEGLELRDRFGGEAVRVERLELRYDVWALAAGKVHVERLEVWGPRVRLAATAGGGVNLAELVVPSEQEQEPSSKPVTFRLQVDQLKLGRGRFTLDKSMGGPLKVSTLELDVGAKLRLKGGGITAGLKALVLQAGGITLPDGQRLSMSLTGDAGISEQQVFAGLKLGAEGLVPARAVNLRLTAAGTLAKPQVELDLLLPGGGQARLKANAELSRTFELGRYGVELALDKINPAALWPGLPRAMAALKLKVTGQGIPLKKSALVKVDLRSDGARVLDYKLDRLGLLAVMDGQRWTVKTLDARAHGARLSATGSGDLKALTSSKIKLELPSLAGLPLPAGVPGLAGAVALDASVKGPFSGPLSARAELTARQVAVDRMKLGALKLKANVGGLPYKPRGTLVLTLADLDPGAAASVARLKQATLRAKGGMDGLDLELDAAGPRLVAGLGAGLSLKGKRLDLQLRRLALSLDGRRLDLSDKAGARVDLNKELDLGPTRLKLLGGTVALQGKVKQRGQPRLKLGIKARGVRPLKGRPAVNADLEATVGREALAVILKLDAGAKVELRATVPVRYGMGPVPTLALGGDLGLELKVPRLPLSLVRRWVPGLPPLEGTARLNIKAAGSPRSPTGRLILGLDKVGYGGLKGVDGELDLTLERGATSLAASFKHKGADLLKLKLRAGTGAGKVIAARQRLLDYLEAVPLSASLDLTPSSLSLVGHLAPDMKDRLSGKTQVRLALEGTALRPRAKFTFKSKEVKLDGSPMPDLHGSADLVADETRVRTRAKLAAQARPLLFLDGGLGVTLRRLAQGKVAPERIPLAARVELLATDLSRLLAGHPRLGRVRGKLAATATASGTLGKPGATLDLNLKGGGMGRASIGDLGIKAALDPAGKMTADLKLEQKTGGTLLGKAGLDIRRLDKIDLSLKGDDLDLGFVAGLSSRTRQTGGKVNLAFIVKGPVAAPRVLGTLNLKHGSVLLSGMKPLSGIELRLVLKEDRLDIPALGWASGGGKIQGKGQVALSNLRPGAFSMDLTAHNYDLGVDPVKGSQLTTAAKITGGVLGRTIKAEVKLDQSKLKLSKIGGGKDLHRAGALPEVVFVDSGRRREAGGSAADKPSPLGLDISVTVDPLFVRGADLDVEALADVRARTNEQGKVCLYGQARLRRGWVLVLDNKYKVKRATVQFGGQPKPDPALDVLIARDFANVTVSIGVGGTASKPELDLSSEPAVYTQSQILSMILTGNPQVAQKDDPDADPTSAVTAAVLSTVLGPLTREVANTVGLDVAKVSLEEQKDKSEGGDEAVSIKAQAEVGKYITDRIYLGYRKVFGASDDENSHEAILEYAISARWLAMALFGDNNVGGLDIFWTYRY